MATAGAAAARPDRQEKGRSHVAAIVVALLVGVSSWYYTTEIRPPAPTPCGSAGGPLVTAPRIQLKDGRLLAYFETGVPKGEAKYKVIFCHGFGSTRVDILPVSPDLMEELQMYMVSYDRAGYGESDPNPMRSLKSEASDIAELADSLKLGPKFYLIGFSMGGHAVWSSIRYIPGRLAGAALMAPVINYRWPGFPKNLSKEANNKLQQGDRWSHRVSYYAPWLLHWWMKQSWLPSSNVIQGTAHLPNRLDAKVLNYSIAAGLFEKRLKLATQQGLQESYYRDMSVMFGKWDFDPMNLVQPSTPFPVHLWQGDEDGLVPSELQRYIAGRLSWIQYHELPETGHFLTAVRGLCDTILRTLLIQPSLPSTGRKHHL